VGLAVCRRVSFFFFFFFYLVWHAAVAKFAVDGSAAAFSCPKFVVNTRPRLAAAAKRIFFSVCCRIRCGEHPDQVVCDGTSMVFAADFLSTRPNEELHGVSPVRYVVLTFAKFQSAHATFDYTSYDRYCFLPNGKARLLLRSLVE
jgi:hypothetical protein